MLSKIIEFVTGQDDLERIASKDDLNALNFHLKKRRLWFPKRPRGFLDGSNFTQEQLSELMRVNSEEPADGHTELWILEEEGKKVLPAFSSLQRSEVFIRTLSTRLNKVFAVECLEMRLTDVTKSFDFDVLHLNAFSKKSWEIGVK